MDFLFNLLSVAVIGGADGPTAVSVAAPGGLPLPALTVAVVGVAFVLYVYISKAINAKKAPSKAAEATTVAVQAPAAPVYTGPELIGVEENEAAVIMAIVSHKTGIPLTGLNSSQSN